MTTSALRRPTKRERKEAARAARIAAERERLARARRRRRSAVLAAITGAVAVAIAALLLLSPADNAAERASAGAPQGVAEVSAMLSGIPQDGIALGDPKASVTLVEFADLQCPFCRDFAVETLPLIVRDYVRQGKLRIELRALAFIGPDSVRAGRLAQGAAAQDRLWHFTDLFYFNQGAENSGFATDAFLDGLLAEVPGLDAARARRDAGDRLVADAQAVADRHGIQSTPSLLIGRTGSEPHTPVADPLDYEAVKAAIERELGR